MHKWKTNATQMRTYIFWSCLEGIYYLIDLKWVICALSYQGSSGYYFREVDLPLFMS